MPSRPSVRLPDDDRVHSTAQGRLRVARAPSSWSKKDRAVFLAEIARTCNISSTLRKMGKSHSGVYYIRQTDPEFAAAWDVAIQRGYEELESRLLQTALAQMNPDAGASDVAGKADGKAKKPVADTDLAIRMLAAHQKKTATTTQQKPVRDMSDAEADAVILKHLKALHKRVVAAKETRELAQAKAAAKSA
jgi:hypothetical protein